MTLPYYEVWLLNWDYTFKSFLKHWTQFEYKQALNTYGYARLVFDPTNTKIDDMTDMSRILIKRNSVIVFGGIVLREGFTITNTAPRSEEYTISALDVGCYTDWRVVMPPALSEYDRVTDHGDDICKYYVRQTMGAGAIADRQIADVTVPADAHSAPSMTYEARQVILHTILQNVCDESGCRWRMVPAIDGCAFTTYYPIAGLDRTRGNGVNDECIFTIDRVNFDEVSYVKDLLTHYNYIYISGQGEGVDRMSKEGGDVANIGFYKRRERHVDARHITTEATLEARIPAELEERKPVREMAVKPKWTTWKAATGTTFDLGDIITIDVNRWGRTFTFDGEVLEITVTVGDDGLETIVPTLHEVD